MNIVVSAEHGTDMGSMFDSRCEDQDRLPVAGCLDDLSAGGPNKIVLIHGRIDLAGDELTASDVQLAQVRLLLACLRDQRAQVVVTNELTNACLKADVTKQLVWSADQARIHSKRRGGQADQSDQRIDYTSLGEERLIHALAAGR